LRGRKNDEGKPVSPDFCFQERQQLAENYFFLAAAFLGAAFFGAGLVALDFTVALAIRLI
jgi:hypothetical protein